ncbi:MULTISPECIES: hypothetical protein [unclassified Leisingera]|uniref:hypothetical protein n=1 Tax=unclassified Leisingera TaxID=2614906 RepID=UPI0010129157|nr:MULTISPECIES: hypothetical protein [unclassified Leisingera]MBQ4825665.1 hypothetical protein [Leisingera sp. HS039]MCF6433413.1 hypothetical protein [Leisingera sp. MMG026]QAX32395.1 hypothetical protein ETW24_23710 [Leisingera sp. NJS204]QBR39013.1 hypothetical protein ETW23_24585 [Leisingera sp. NJS201]
MMFLARIFRLIRVAAAFAVVLVLGFSLPSAAHSVAGHHSNAAMSHDGQSHTASFVAGVTHKASHIAENDGQDTAQYTADAGNCCAGACMALAILSLQPDAAFVQQPVRWVMASAQLPSQDRVKVLRPPRS